MKTLTIGKIAKESGVGVETIRFYERKGLITQPPKPSTGGYREYPIKMIGRIRFIRQAQEIGFSLREIEMLMSLLNDPLADCSNIHKLTERKLEETTQKIAKVKKIQTMLKKMITTSPCQAPLEHCAIVESIRMSDTLKGV